MISNLGALIKEATNIKPAFGQDCNNCGWCCLTEVCPVGVELSGSTAIPCQYLESGDGKHLCGLALRVESIREAVAIGVGCDAMTQDERLQELCSG